MTFDYRTASAREIEALGRDLIGRALDSFSTDPLLFKPSSAATKGKVGAIYEAYFGIAPNSRGGPDFIGAGIELKSVPILLVGTEARAKERISLGMIDWKSLPTETWATAHARRKLEHLMLIFYEWSPFRPLGYFSTLAAGLWKTDANTLAALEQDWLVIQKLEIEGRRAEVSESLTKSLGAATKGPGHGSTSRAWSLKQPFVGWIYRSMTGQTPLPMRTQVRDPEQEFERAMLAKLRAVEGKTIVDVATRVGMTVGRDKSAAARVVRHVLGQKSKGRHGDFERFGVELKTVPIDHRGRPVESTSFPSFVHEEIQFETWPDSDLLGRLNRILFVPIRRSKGQPQGQGVLQRAFFWSPPERDLVEISLEWERYRALISAGRARDLPKASETVFIHVRPKARNAQDREMAPGGFEVIRKSFWLNSGYVERIIREHGARPG
jgi:DNA mismatch repair protein MutH